MKNWKTSSCACACLASAALLLLSGCKQETLPPPSGTEKTPTSQSAQPVQLPAVVTQTVETAKTVAKTVQTQAVATAQHVATNVIAPATTAVTAASTEAEGLLAQLKGLVKQENYQEGLKLVQQISNLKLTPEQQKLYEDLKKTIQSALAKKTANDAASALGNALGGKK